MIIVGRVFGVALAATVLAFSGAAVRAESTLATVKKRGELVCGVNGSLPAFSYLDEKKERVGFDAEFCRAVAAAVLGDAKKVKFVTLSLSKRFDALKSGEIDLLVRHTTISLDRTAAASGVRYAAVTFIDGQAFVVPRTAGVSSLAGLDGKSICVTKDAPHKGNVETWFTLRGISVTATPFDDQDEMYKAFFEGKCAGVSQEATILASTVIATGKASEYLMLPEIISREPLGPFVRNGDDGWYDIVHWTQNVMIEAEERGLRKATVDEDLGSKDPAVRMLLGVEPGQGRALGLDDKWAYNIVKQVGNYAEVYDRNFGAGSPLKFGRGVNALWGKGGVMYSLPMR
jgi:general L-amino acid transport system substrate-binding protein